MGPTSSHGWVRFPCGSAARAGRPWSRRRRYRRSPARRRGQQPRCAATILPRFKYSRFGCQTFRSGMGPPALTLTPMRGPGGRPAISALLVRHSDAAQFGDASDFDPFHDEDVSLVVEAGAVRAIQLAGLLALAAERADVLVLAALSLVAWTVWCDYSAARSTVHTLAQMGPPILNVAAARGFGTCKPAGALPSSCSALQPIMAIPVAPMGCPLAIRPPDVLMAHSPPGAALPSTQYWAPLPGSALPITSVPSAPITVKQSCTSATFTSSGVRRDIR